MKGMNDKRKIMSILSLPYRFKMERARFQMKTKEGRINEAKWAKFRWTRSIVSI